MRVMFLAYLEQPIFDVSDYEHLTLAFSLVGGEESSNKRTIQAIGTRVYIVVGLGLKKKTGLI